MGALSSLNGLTMVAHNRLSDDEPIDQEEDARMIVDTYRDYVSHSCAAGRVRRLTQRSWFHL